MDIKDGLPWVFSEYCIPVSSSTFVGTIDQPVFPIIGLTCACQGKLLPLTVPWFGDLLKLCKQGQTHWFLN